MCGLYNVAVDVLYVRHRYLYVEVICCLMLQSHSKKEDKDNTDDIASNKEMVLKLPKVLVN